MLVVSKLHVDSLQDHCNEHRQTDMTMSRHHSWRSESLQDGHETSSEAKSAVGKWRCLFTCSEVVGCVDTADERRFRQIHLGRDALH